MSSGITQEHLQAVREEILHVQFVIEHLPETPVGEIHLCACNGPLPECSCKRRRRLLAEFLELTEEVAYGPA